MNEWRYRSQKSPSPVGHMTYHAFITLNPSTISILPSHPSESLRTCERLGLECQLLGIQVGAQEKSIVADMSSIVVIEQIVQISLAQARKVSVTLSTYSQRACLALVDRTSCAYHAALHLCGFLGGGGLDACNEDERVCRDREISKCSIFVGKLRCRVLKALPSRSEGLMDQG